MFEVFFILWCVLYGMLLGILISNPEELARSYLLIRRAIIRRLYGDFYIKNKMPRRWRKLARGLYEGGLMDTIYLHPFNSKQYTDKMDRLGVLFHEIGHWSGNYQRLRRRHTGAVTAFSKDAKYYQIWWYLREEIVAEKISVELKKHFRLPRKYHKSESYGRVLDEFRNHIDKWDEWHTDDIRKMSSDQVDKETVILTCKQAIGSRGIYREIIKDARKAVKFILKDKDRERKIKQHVKAHIMGHIGRSGKNV